jgi:catechol 2,3-dioxygenase
MTTPDPTIPNAETPLGLNHLVLNVRDIEESHRFWTEILGFRQVGALRPRAGRARTPTMRFYSGERDGRPTHHDVALVEQGDQPPPGISGLNHVAIALPGRQAWLRQLDFLRARGIAFGAPIHRGITESVFLTDPNGFAVEILYELPRAAWEGDIDAAINAIQTPPTETPPAETMAVEREKSLAADPVL